MKKVFVMMLVCLVLATAIFSTALTGSSPDSESNAPGAEPRYAAITGTVVEITAYVDADQAEVPGWYFVGIEEENGNLATLLLSDETCYPFAYALEVGDTVTGYYVADRPMLMIYPPQYQVIVLVADMPEGKNIKVARFEQWVDGQEDALISDDGDLAIRMGENTMILFAEGAAFDGELAGKDLVAVYDAATMSIPAQATPVTIIVLRGEPENG